MLTGLCGNKNIERVLLFLFVNTKCYGAQLQRLLKIPLTTLQNAFSRLEKGGVIESHCEGKTRFYRFAKGYPLLQELEELLRKTYTLLPPQEKRLYSLIEVNQKMHGPLLSSFWDSLKKVSQFTRTGSSKAQAETGWSGEGKGSVIVTVVSDKVLLFSERGSWKGKHGESFAFTNTFRWTIDRHSGVISLEHLRLGPTQPVFLFYLAVDHSRQCLSSVESHLCELDAYFATASWDHQGIRLKWRVIGPKKNEDMDYYYF